MCLKGCVMCTISHSPPQWPTDYDAHFLSNVLHDWDMAACKVLVKHSFDALPKGGKIYRTNPPAQ